MSKTPSQREEHSLEAKVAVAGLALVVILAVFGVIATSLFGKLNGGLQYVVGACALGFGVVGAAAGWFRPVEGFPRSISSLIGVAAAAAIVVVVGIPIALLLQGGSGGSSSVGTGPGSEVLSPATVPPVVGICSEQLSFGADGNVGPLFCSNKEINRLAWKYFAGMSSPSSSHLRVMALGPNATPGDVEAAVSSDMNFSTGAIECSAYQLAAVYYGWSFGVDPTSGVINGGCPIER